MLGVSIFQEKHHPKISRCFCSPCCHHFINDAFWILLDDYTSFLKKIGGFYKPTYQACWRSTFRGCPINFDLFKVMLFLKLLYHGESLNHHIFGTFSKHQTSKSQGKMRLFGSLFFVFRLSWRQGAFARGWHGLEGRFGTSRLGSLAFVVSVGRMRKTFVQIKDVFFFVFFRRCCAISCNFI